MNSFLFLSIFAYLSGSIPNAFWLGKLKKIDVRKFGSRSITETNLARALGWRYGIFGGILDVLKAIVPTFLAKKFLISPYQVILIAILPTIGHLFPVYLKFKYGGRGASTFFGASFVLFGPKFFLPVFVIWFLIFALTRKTSLTNLIFPWIFTFLIYFWCQLSFFPFAYFFFGIFESILLNFALRNNIRRIIKGRELETPLRF